MKNPQIGAIVLSDKHRTAGEAEIDGKLVKWGSGYMLTYIPFEGVKVVKREVDPDQAQRIEKILENVSWGALVSLTFQGKYISDVTVESDPVGDLATD